MTIPDAVRDQAERLIACRLGLSFPESRRADLERSLLQVFHPTGRTDPEAYLAQLAMMPDESPEWQALAGLLTVGETYFFRDASCFEALGQVILPALIETRRSVGQLFLRFWSAACATGEEPYSLAMVLDRLIPDRSNWALTILATDIRHEALAHARRGFYREWFLRDTPPEVRDRYFHRRGAEIFEVDPMIRKMVTFAPLNLGGTSYPPSTKTMDVILCRNVLMYFTRDAQRTTVAHLRDVLALGGWLAVSPAEASSDLMSSLVPVNFPGAIFYRNTPRPVHQPVAQSRVAVRAARGQASPEKPPHMPVLSPSEAPVIPQSDSFSLFHRARNLADQGRLEEARQACESRLAQVPLDFDAYLLLAAIHQERGEIPQALAVLRRAIYVDPDSALAHFLLGNLLFRNGESRPARRCMETVIQLVRSCQPDQVVAIGEGLTAGRLLESARAHLEQQETAEGHRRE